MFSKLSQASKGWKTIIFGLAILALPLLEYLQTVDTEFITKSPWFPVAVGGGVIVLRALTVAPMFNRYRRRYTPEE